MAAVFSLLVSVPASHAGDRGSNPARSRASRTLYMCIQDKQQSDYTAAHNVPLQQQAIFPTAAYEPPLAVTTVTSRIVLSLLHLFTLKSQPNEKCLCTLYCTLKGITDNLVRVFLWPTSLWPVTLVMEQPLSLSNTKTKQ